MAVREDLVASAIAFLQDPSVANAPLDKRIAFLQSKNLTQEEIDVSLSRSSESNASFPTSSANVQQAPPQSYAASYNGSNRQNFYAQPSRWQDVPPQVPQRDWRDYFIMATVMSGLSYGIYFISKRYIAPLIAPPTPAQLDQDKASVNESFERAFSLIDQLAADTSAIKQSEDARKSKLDGALDDLEVATTELKSSSRRRDEEIHRISEEVRNLQGLVPKAIKSQEENTDTRLRELNSELKSLKTLISNRLSSNPQPPGSSSASRPSAQAENDSGSHVSPMTAETLSSEAANDTTASPSIISNGNAATAASHTDPWNTASSTSSSPFGRFGGSKGGIPAWQMAAAKAKTPNKDSADNVVTTSTEEPLES